MAKKVRNEDEEAPAFKFPEFDEKEYLREEIRDAKAVIASTLLALPIAAAAALLTASVHPTAGILLGLAGFGGIYYLFKLMFKDISVFKPKHWLMNIGGYFFTFLAVWILLINPPFMDLAGPVIEDPQYSVSYPTFVDADGGLIDLPEGTTDWILRVSAADNVELASAPQYSISGGPASTMVPVSGEPGLYEAPINQTGEIVITVSDVNGHDVEYVVVCVP
jgi:hypothetical protein